MGFAKAQKVRAPVAGAPDADAPPGLGAALDCLRIAITMYDCDERLVYANQHFDYLFPNLPKRGALIGTAYGEIVRLEALRGEIAAEALGADIDDFVARRRAQLIDGDLRPFDLMLADGRIIEIKSRPSGESGWIALWSDVTAARQSMGRLESAIALSADAFAFFDHQDRLVVCNQDFAALYGRAAEALRGIEFRALIGEAVKRVRVDGDGDAWIARRLDLHNSPAGAMTVEMKSGKAYLVRDRRTRDGRVTVLTDVTDERRVKTALDEQSGALERTREALERSQREAAQQASYLADLTQRLDRASASADTTKKTLLRTMSHELKTPLNAIIGFSDLLNQMADRFDVGQVREYASLIHAGGQNLLRLINQILDLTKLAGGKFEPRPVRIDVSGALWVAKDAFGERAAAKNIALNADGCPVGLFAEVDENAFGQMVSQLIDNAVTFTQAGGAVTLSAEMKGGRVQLVVADNGPGVEPEDIGRILEPFEQVGRTTTDHAQGAGLGLTLAKAFAEVHGGSLSVASLPGQGFTAIIELPAA